MGSSKLFYGENELLITKAEKKEKASKQFHKDSSYDVHEGRTLFVTNVPYSADNEQILEFFQEFGKIKYAICMMNKDTDTCKGSAFVQFLKKSDTDKVLDLGNKNQLEFE